MNAFLLKLNLFQNRFRENYRVISNIKLYKYTDTVARLSEEFAPKFSEFRDTQIQYQICTVMNVHFIKSLVSDKFLNSKYFAKKNVCLFMDQCTFANIFNIIL